VTSATTSAGPAAPDTARRDAERAIVRVQVAARAAQLVFSALMVVNDRRRYRRPAWQWLLLTGATAETTWLCMRLLRDGRYRAGGRAEAVVFEHAASPCVQASLLDDLPAASGASIGTASGGGASVASGTGTLTAARSGGSATGTVAAVIILLLLVGGVAFVVVRRRAGSSPGAAPDR
jgi:hypothetical protein